MLKLLITGGSGFIGTNFIDTFSSKYIFKNIDNRPPKINEQKKYWENIDILDFNSLFTCIQSFKPDYIVHLAAKTDLNGRHIESYNANSKGVENVLRAIENIKNLRKIIITSSMLVCSSGYIPRDEFDYCPTTLYGQSKVLTEKITWTNNINVDWAIIRPTSIWGPWFNVPYRDFFGMIIKKKYIHIGNISCTKTYGYVGNSVYQIEKILLANTEDKNNKVFYIGDEPPTNIETWANEIASCLNYKIFRVPSVFFYVAAILGDLLKTMGIKFPMTSFRLRNMKTNNIIDLSKTQKIASKPPFSRMSGIKITLNWMSQIRD